MYDTKVGSLEVSRTRLTDQRLYAIKWNKTALIFISVSLKSHSKNLGNLLPYLTATFQIPSQITNEGNPE